MLTRALTIAAGAALLLTLAGCGSHGTSASAAADNAPAGSSSSPSGAGRCSYPADPAGASKKVDPPPSTPSENGKVRATITSSVGALHLTLDATKAPCTVNSFVSLADQGFYDGTSCHRLGDATGFELLQCGDPTGTGTGGPGYSILDEYDGSETYPAGTLAMARASQPNSGGSQFFMVFGDTQLSPKYTVFGTLDQAAVKALAKVGKAGNDGAWGDGTGRPIIPVTFTKVTVR
ncbi:peptidylprolyl isomerase [Nocardioides sp. DS6]|uniref:Peptidylprolyl isomerase n=1 Tax=Nocardioides eburneus TaxID=3231482 RepID=A0ABV3T3J7_9ACTN